MISKTPYPLFGNPKLPLEKSSTSIDLVAIAPTTVATSAVVLARDDMFKSLNAVYVWSFTLVSKLLFRTLVL